MSKLVRTSVIDGGQANWSDEALEQLADKLPGVKVRDRTGSTLDLERGTEKDCDPIVGEVDSCAVIGREVIATLRLKEGFDHGRLVGISASATKDGERIVSVEKVDSLGLDDDPRSCSWGEVIG